MNTQMGVLVGEDELGARDEQDDCEEAFNDRLGKMPAANVGG